MKPTLVIPIPPTLEAMQYTDSAESAAAIFAWASDVTVGVRMKPNGVELDTLRGAMHVPIDGWLIREADGSYTSATSEFFNQCYKVWQDKEEVNKE